MKSPYYVPSGKASAAGIAAYCVVGLLAAWLLGFVYVLIVEFIPFIYAAFFATIGFGAGMGWVLGYIAKQSHIRAPQLGCIIATLIAIAGYAIHWVAFVAVYCGRAEGSVTTALAAYVGCLTHPADLFGFIGGVYEHGHFTLGKNSRDAVTGLFLGAIWLGEAVLIIAGAPYVAYIQLSHRYSEKLKRWAKSEKLPHAFPFIENVSTLKSALEAGKIEELFLAEKKNEKVPENTYRSSVVTLITAEGDDDCHYMSLDNITIVKKGKKEDTKTQKVVKYLRIDPAFCALLREGPPELAVADVAAGDNPPVPVEALPNS